MHLPQILALLAFLLVRTALGSALTPRASGNGPCTGAGGAPGVCISTSDCSAAGGTSISNACPGTPNDIKCCTKPTCGSNGSGNCRFTSQCASGNTQANLCPGHPDFKCCLPNGSGPNSEGNLGDKILAKAKQAAGLPC